MSKASKNKGTKSWFKWLFANKSSRSDKPIEARRNIRSEDPIESQLEGLLKQCPPAKLLNALSFWASVHPMATVLDGQDPKVIQSNLEFIQAALLRAPLDSYHNEKLLIEDEVFLVNSLALELAEAIIQRENRQNTKIHKNIYCKEYLTELYLCEQILVRNPGGYRSRARILTSFEAELDLQFKHRAGYQISDVRKFLNGVHDTITDRRRNFFQKLEDLWVIDDKQHLWIKFQETFKVDNDHASYYADCTASIKSLSDLKLTLFAFSLNHCETDTVFEFQTLKELADGRITDLALSRLIDSLSLGFGDERTSSLRQLRLENQTSLKPFIKFPDGRIGVYLPHCQSAKPLDLLLQDSVLAKTKVLNWVQENKSRIVENDVGAVLRKIFPADSVYLNVKRTEKLHGQEGEIDVLVSLNGMVLAIEVKAKHQKRDPEVAITPSLLKKIARKVVLEPSQQCKKFFEFIHNQIGTVSMSSDDGSRTVEINLQQLDLLIGLTITLDHIGEWAKSIQLLKSVQLARGDELNQPAMSIFEFHDVIEFLSDADLLLHYLYKRNVLEQSVNYVGDEFDLLAQYYEDNLRMETVPHTVGGLLILGRKTSKLTTILEGRTHLFKSESLPLFISGKIPVRMHDQWYQLTQKLTKKRPLGWSKALMILLNTPLAEQGALLMMLERFQLSGCYQNGMQKLGTVSFCTNDAKQAICFIVHSKVDAFDIQQTCLSALSELLTQEDCKEGVVVAFENGKHLSHVCSSVTARMPLLL